MANAALYTTRSTSCLHAFPTFSEKWLLAVTFRCTATISRRRAIWLISNAACGRSMRKTTRIACRFAERYLAIRIRLGRSIEGWRRTRLMPVAGFEPGLGHCSSPALPDGCPALKLPETRHFLYGRLPFARQLCVARRVVADLYPDSIAGMPAGPDGFRRKGPNLIGGLEVREMSQACPCTVQPVLPSFNMPVQP